MNADATAAAALSNNDDETYRCCVFIVNTINCERPRGYLSKPDVYHVLNK